jgi:hypothetical protein
MCSSVTLSTSSCSRLVYSSAFLLRVSNRGSPGLTLVVLQQRGRANDVVLELAPALLGAAGCHRLRVISWSCPATIASRSCWSSHSPTSAMAPRTSGESSVDQLGHALGTAHRGVAQRLLDLERVQLVHPDHDRACRRRPPDAPPCPHEEVGQTLESCLHASPNARSSFSSSPGGQPAREGLPGAQFLVLVLWCSLGAQRSKISRSPSSDSKFRVTVSLVWTRPE